MFIHVTAATYRGDYKIGLTFNDGTEGEIDLAAELDGEIFEPLKDQEFFKSFKIEGYTLTWDNGADFAPEFLREHIALHFAINDIATSRVGRQPLAD